MAYGLEGVRVIETAGGIAGPMCGRLLADWGSDVIHIEQPRRAGSYADTSRRYLTNRLAASRTRIPSDIDYSAENLQRNKRGMVLDLSKQSGREILIKLLEKADVFVSNYRPREITKFGLEYETLSQLNPRLIHGNISGYGMKGPDRDVGAYEHTAYFARGGIFHIYPPPGSFPIGMGDNITGMTLFSGIMTALFIRERTGRGQQVDTSLYSCGIFAISDYIAGTLVTGEGLGPVERKNVNNVLVDHYLTKDRRWLRLGMPAPDPYWPRFCKAIEREDLEHDPRFETFAPRVENQGTLFNILEDVFAKKTLDEWRVRLNEAGALWAPIQNLVEIVNDPQTRANDYFIPFDHPTYGHIEVVANPVQLSETPEMIRSPSPKYGQHTEEVLLEAGYTRKDIEKLKEQGVIIT